MARSLFQPAAGHPASERVVVAPLGAGTQCSRPVWPLWRTSDWSCRRFAANAPASQSLARFAPARRPRTATGRPTGRGFLLDGGAFSCPFGHGSLRSWAVFPRSGEQSGRFLCASATRPPSAAPTSRALGRNRRESYGAVTLEKPQPRKSIAAGGRLPQSSRFGSREFPRRTGGGEGARIAGRVIKCESVG